MIFANSRRGGEKPLAGLTIPEIPEHYKPLTDHRAECEIGLWTDASTEVLKLPLNGLRYR